jgi:two-component sensor histidine kinase
MDVRVQPERGDIAESLGLAVIASSMVPLLLLDSDFVVLAASTSFCRTYHVAAEHIVGQRVFDLGDGEWELPKLRSLLLATLSGAEIDAYELDLVTPGRGPLRLVLNAHLLNHGVDHSQRILLTVADVTEARLDEARHAATIAEKDELLRQKAVLLQEIRHRIANSLQIIASVLLQNARRVSSEESRSHLRDAHQRVMSVAALQHQLAASSVEGVPLRGYFNHLCESIAASMIADPQKIRLSVDADETIVESDTSISLGLIVTELVINALKHAFPKKHEGAITVAYRAEGPDWWLSVTDDGVGMPTTPKAVAGLGTSIVNALAQQLQADVTTQNLAPGAAVTVAYKHGAPIVSAI